jgi:hypothetical protein
MSSYANYCQEQATDCARRAKLATSPEMVAYCRSLEFRWLRLSEQAQETGGALGHESGPTAPVSPLRDKTATYPAEYGKRAGELIARGVRSLHPTLRQKKRTHPRQVMLRRGVVASHHGIRSTPVACQWRVADAARQ